MQHKKRVEQTRVCISKYRFLTVQPRVLISSSLVTLHARDKIRG